MSITVETRVLTHDAALDMLRAACAKATEIGQPQCVVVVDASGVEIAVIRMTGARYLSLKSARAKARTAASTGTPSADIPDPVKPLIALATQTEMTGMPGGLPIRVEGVLVGGIGVGSGSGDEDIAVARAGLDAIGAQ